MREDILKAQQMIKTNYGVDYDPVKFNLLTTLIFEEGWTKKRFEDTVKWFLKNKKFPTWTVADWFEYGVKLYPHSWYVEQITTKGATDSQMEKYRIDGKVFWKYKDGQELPFEKIP